MGDCSYTMIIINKAFAVLVDLLIDETLNRIRSVGSETIRKYFDSEASYGNIDWLETLLEEHFVPYDKYWEKGGDYGPGAKHVRVLAYEEPAEMRLSIKEYEDDEGLLLAEEFVSIFESEGAPVALARAKAVVETTRPLEPELEECWPTSFHLKLLHELETRSQSDAEIGPIPAPCETRRPYEPGTKSPASAHV